MNRLVCAVTLAIVAFGGRVAVSAEAQDVDRRAAAVEARMTDLERLQLVHGLMVIPLPGKAAPPAGIPFTAGYIEGIARLGIPDILESDASLGVVNPLQMRTGDSATAMPSGLAQASSFDSALVYRGGAMMGKEAAAHGINVLLAGGVNLARDPRNGRNFEYFGEDPLLAGTLAGAQVSGVQAQGVVSTVKHFALNDQETLRQSLDAQIDEAALRESDLLAFEFAIERGHPGAVMCSYNQVNGARACDNQFLLDQVLKVDWHYPGWVMSDWGATGDVVNFAHGLDQESGAQLDQQIWFDQPLQGALADGKVPHARLSEAVHRIVRSLYAVGADAPHRPQVDYAADASVARQSESEGIVLLKNEAALPLNPALKHIAIIGGRAEDSVLSGGGSSEVTPHGVPFSTVRIGGCGFMSFIAHQMWVGSSPMNALQASMPQTTFSYDPGYDRDQAAALAATADAVVVFATRWQMEGCDAGSLDLPQGQNELIRAVSAANHNVIVVLETGNPVAMPWLSEVKAVLEAWYPGQEGGPAIADVLTGAVNPSGHLPVTFPADLSQTPHPTLAGLGLPEPTPISVRYSEGAEVGYRWMSTRGLKPLFPFGYGLSYTRFDLDGLTFTQRRGVSAQPGGVSAQVRLRNTGDRAGAAVPQVYLVSAAGHPVTRLVGFGRVVLQPGEAQTVDLSIDPRLLAHWDPHAHGWRVDAGRYEFALGEDALHFGSRATLEIRGQTLRP